MEAVGGTDSQVSSQKSENQESHSNEKTFSSIHLYQMALPHIIQSNLRVQKLVSNEKKKQRVIQAHFIIIIHIFRKITLKEFKAFLIN